MKVIIAGGRDYKPDALSHFVIHCNHHIFNFTEIVSGGCTGADKFGEEYAKEYGIPVKRFPADGGKHGKKAGPIRNDLMAQYADAVILFPGGRGTENMRKAANRYGLEILFDANK